MGVQTLQECRNLYAGRTVFIIGNGTELNTLDPCLLKDQIVIGCNASYLWKQDSNFFIAGHAIFPMLWELNAVIKDTGVFHWEPFLPIKNVINHAKRCLSSETDCFKNDIGNDAYLLGNDMVGFSATHLDLIIGAKNIVYIGFDSKHPNHFYDFDPYYFILEEQVRKLKANYIGNEGLMKEIEEFESRHFPPGKNAMGFVLRHYQQNKDKFSVLFKLLKHVHNINVYATEMDSITIAAGGTYKPLEELILC